MDKSQIGNRTRDIDHITMKPRIAVKRNNKTINYDLFCNKNNIYKDLKFLATIWFDLLPEKDMTLAQKQLEIAQYLAGKRKTNKFIELITNI